MGAEEQPPPIVKRRRKVFANTCFDVFADDLSASEFEVEDFLVVAPRTTRSDLLAGVVVVPVRDCSILLLSHYRHPVSAYLWALPRGFIESGEAPVSAALRELTEETGLLCAEDNLVDLGCFMPDPGIIRARVQVFAAICCELGTGVENSEIGIQARRWVTEQEVRRMLTNGLIEEAATSLALHRYFRAVQDRRIPQGH